MPQSSYPWLEHYPQGVPTTIELDPDATLTQQLDAACKRYPDRIALVFMGVECRYQQLDEQAERVAAWLQSQGLRQGDRVAVMMPNTIANVCIMLGVLRAGMVLVNLNPQYTASELTTQLKDSQPAVLFLLENFAHVLSKVESSLRPKHIVLSRVGEVMGLKGAVINFVVKHIQKRVPAYQLPDVTWYSTLQKQAQHLTFKAPTIQADDIALLQYTGGTTGVPKAACLTQRNLLANIEQIRAYAQPVLGDLANPAKTMLCALPLYHIFALTVCGFLSLAHGMRVVLIIDPRDLSSILKAWRHSPPTIVPAVNTLFNALTREADFAKLPFESLKFGLGGGAAVQQSVAERWQQLTGTPLLEGYGLSETSPVVSVNPIDATEYAADIGFPLPSTLVRVIDEAGQDVPIGEQGELVVKGPQVMHEYWRQPERTQEAFTADGFFKTGDIAQLSPQGRIKLVDRKKDMVIVSGFNVYPNEVEAVLAQHPQVKEAAVIGVPDERTGEAVKAIVVPADHALTEDSLKQWCREHLTGYKRPHVYEFRESLPKNNIGKVLRRVLRDEEKGDHSEPPS